MVDYEYKSLNQLYQLLLEKPVRKISELKSILGEPKIEIITRLKTLESMGLGLSYDAQRVRLNHSIDAIDCVYLQKKLQSHKIDKPLCYCFSTTSTNQIASNNKTPSIYISDYQSQGKGRLNKTWVTPLGQSIAMSIGHAFECGISEISGLNIAIGVAIINTIEQFSGKEVGLKWPNDVIGNKGKIAGILVEVSGNNQFCFAVIGIGLNWNVRQSILNSVDKKCMNLKPKDVTRSEFISKLIVNVHQILQEFSNNKLENILPIWNKHDCYVGKRIDIIQESSTNTAKYIGVNSQGYLSVELEGKPILLASGEVSIRQI